MASEPYSKKTSGRSEASPQNANDENYSLDEMMNRLKKDKQHERRSNRARDGELVTREDGTKMVKVRRKKRRSSQSSKKKKSQSNPKLKWAALGTVTALLILLAAGTIIIIAKFNGRKFKEATEANICELSGADSTTFTQLRVTPISAKANKTELTWAQDSFIKDAEFSTINAKIKATSFFTNDWIGEEIVASKGKVHLQTPSTTAQASVEKMLSPYQFDAYRCSELDLNFGSEPGSPAIHDLQVSLRQIAPDVHQLVFKDGTLKIKNWPELELYSGVVTLNPEHSEIETLLKSETSLNGELTITGSIPKQTSTAAKLEVKTRSYPIQELLGKELGRLIKGEIESERGFISYDYTKPGSQGLSLTLPFTASEILCEDFPMFKDLKNLTGDTQFIRPVFSSCEGTISRTSSGVRLHNLQWTSRGLLTMTGEIAVDAKKQLSGTLTVGVAKTAFPHREAPSIMSEPVNGYHQIEVTLSGHIQNPNDNLHEQLKKARASSVIRPGKTMDRKFIPAPLTPPVAPKTVNQKDWEELSR